MNPTDRFTDALHQLETTRNLESLMTLFTPEAELHSFASATPARGQQQARKFWQRYRDAFKHVYSRFTHRLETDHSTALEWIAEGELSSGQAIRYQGISVLEWENDKITRFRTYYDSAAFLPVSPKVEQATNDADAQ